MFRTRSIIRPLVLCGALFVSEQVVLEAPSAWAFDAVTTQAGLTQQAALASRLHRRLIQRLVHPLGLFEPLRLDLGSLPSARARSYYARLIGLDPAEGYAPEWQQSGSLSGPVNAQAHPLGRQHALGWLAAGTVLESSPADRMRNHFYDPRTGSGLKATEEQSLRTSMLSVKYGISSLRQLIAGAAVDGTGTAAPDWLMASEAVNDLGLQSFMRAYDRAERAELPAQRESALAEVLLCAGAMLGVLTQMGDPSFLHSDLEDVLKAGDAGSLAVSTRFGRASVPPPSSNGAAGASELPESLRALFADGHGGGLAEQTVRRCGTSPRQVRCYTSDAQSQLALTARFGQRLIDYLFRGELRLSLGDGGHRLDVTATELPLGSGTLTLIGEQPEGRRRVLKSAATLPTLVGAQLTQFTISDEERHDLHRLVVLFQGRDRHNEAIITSAQIVLPRPSSP